MLNIMFFFYFFKTLQEAVALLYHLLLGLKLRGPLAKLHFIWTLTYLHSVWIFINIWYNDVPAPACGRRCVLSLRPERCGNKTENEKSKEAEESEGGKSAADGMVDESRKAGEENKRARSCVARTRATVMSDARPSTAPAYTRAGRSDVNTLEGSPGSPCSLNL